MAKPKITNLSEVEIIYGREMTIEINSTNQGMNKKSGKKYCQIFKFDECSDQLYYGRLEGDIKSDNAESDEFSDPPLDKVNAVLRKVPDKHIYFKPPRAAPGSPTPLHVVAEPIQEDFHVKRPNIKAHHDLKKGGNDADTGYDIASIATWFRAEVTAHEMIQEKSEGKPHPHIVQYLGCRVRRGFVTGIVLRKTEGVTLTEYLQTDQKIDKKRFMAALKSAVTHLHSVVGVAHNNINADNIMVDTDGMPVLVGFSACRPLGDKIGAPVGTLGWVEGGFSPNGTSSVANDLFALERLPFWLGTPGIMDIFGSWFPGLEMLVPRVQGALSEVHKLTSARVPKLPQTRGIKRPAPDQLDDERPPRRQPSPPPPQRGAVRRIISSLSSLPPPQRETVRIIPRRQPVPTREVPTQEVPTRFTRVIAKKGWEDEGDIFFKKGFKDEEGGKE